MGDLVVKNLGAEWLEADGSGGFASGPVGLERTRRYHALLLTATQPPTGRIVLVNGVEAWITTAQGSAALSSAFYAPGVMYPDGQKRIAQFTAQPWPRWVFRLGGDDTAEHEIIVCPQTRMTLLRWRCSIPATLTVRPMLSGRDYHALHAENSVFRFDAAQSGQGVTWQPYQGLPKIAALSNGSYRHDPLWYRKFLYRREQERGLDFLEDLGSPGAFEFRLDGGEAVLLLRAGEDFAGAAEDVPAKDVTAQDVAAHLVTTETARRRGAGASLAASAYVARRAAGSTLIAGYPWFTDWGRDSFIALRGLLLSTGAHDTAVSILLAWAGQVSEGMVPNRFTDDGPAEYNTADASLWFVVAVHDALLCARNVSLSDFGILRGAADAIIEGHCRGTRFGIGMDADGLLRAGLPGTQLTWMDARTQGVAVTPRVGKPVEIQALWYNALRIAAAWNFSRTALAERVQAAFLARFPDAATGGLVDVVDVDHVAGTVDSSVRPNQIFAVGGLPFAIADGALAEKIVGLVEKRLLTPMGLRTLDPADPRYAARYAGGPVQRDQAYHQGTAWPYLIGAFVEAWLRVHGPTPANKALARQRFLSALADYRAGCGFGHLPEVADGEAPHAAGGCPFQAWSLGEFLRAWDMTERQAELLF